MNKTIGPAGSSSSFSREGVGGDSFAHSAVQQRDSMNSKQGFFEHEKKRSKIPDGPLRSPTVRKRETNELGDLLSFPGGGGSIAAQSSHSYHGFSSDFRQSTDFLAEGFIRVTVTRNGKQEEMIMDAANLLELKARQNATRQRLHGAEDLLTVPAWVQLHPLLGSYVTEAIGTFAWSLSMSLGKASANRSIFDPLETSSNVDMLPTGLLLSALIFAFGYISGGHFNPAVSLAVFLAREITFSIFLVYMIVQCLAALGGGFVGMLILNNSDIFVPSVASDYISRGLFSEWIFSLAIALIALNTRYSRQRSNFYYGIGMGMGVAAGYAAVSSISGGSFNPAIATGLQAAKCFAGDCGPLKVFWIYWLGPVVGATVAALFFSQIDQPEEASPFLVKDSAVVPPELPVEILEKRLKEEEERAATTLVEEMREAVRAELRTPFSVPRPPLYTGEEYNRSRGRNVPSERVDSSSLAQNDVNRSAEWLEGTEPKMPSALKKKNIRKNSTMHSRSEVGLKSRGGGGEMSEEYGAEGTTHGSPVTASRLGGAPLRIQFSGVNEVVCDQNEEEEGNSAKMRDRQLPFEH